MYLHYWKRTGLNQRKVYQLEALPTKNHKSLSQKDPQSFPRMESILGIPGLAYKEHQLKKVRRPQGKARRKKRKRDRNPAEKVPSNETSAGWAIPQVNPMNGKVLFSTSSVRPWCLQFWLLVWLWFLWRFYLYVLQTFQGLIISIHKIQNVSLIYLTILHSLKAGRTRLVLKVCIVPITSINKRFYCTSVTAFTVKYPSRHKA